MIDKEDKKRIDALIESMNRLSRLLKEEETGMFTWWEGVHKLSSDVVRDIGHLLGSSEKGT